MTNIGLCAWLLFPTRLHNYALAGVATAGGAVCKECVIVFPLAGSHFGYVFV